MNDLDFIAFDVETATSELSSICQIGYVIVSKGEIILQESHLVRPPNNEYASRNSCIHGIDALKTKDKPLFPDIWNTIRGHFTSNLLVAHNSSFDLAVLKGTLSYYNLEVPDFNCYCTFRMTGLNLAALCDSLEINLIKHHDALYDAIACAQAYIKLKSGITPDHQLIRARSASNAFAGHERITGEMLKPDLENADQCNPFYCKKVVFTGVLDGISRDDAAKMVRARGADIDSGITRRTHYVIAGIGAGPLKLKKIEQFNAEGAGIRIIEENEFLDMIKYY
jgi:DNA polymerase-3 subunit epsilon